MVVDDNLVHRRMSQTILVAAGYSVTLAEGGPQALAAFEANPPDVVLLDIHMPGMDGFEICRRLRALPSGKKVPILFLTDVSDLAGPDQALLSGGDDFLNKPINRIELLMRVRSLLRIRKAEAILEVLLDTVQESIAVFDSKCVVVKWSQKAAQQLGWSAGEAIGRSLSSLILSPERRAEFDDGIARYLSSGESPIVNARGTFSGTHRSGQPIAIELHVLALRTANETTFCAFIREVESRRS